MQIRMVCLEDGIMSCGFRKMAAYVSRLNPDTRSYFVSTNNYRSFLAAIRGTFGGAGLLHEDSIDEIAQDLATADMVGFSSMTGYADLTRAIIRRVREISRRPYLIWGGIHPIIHPDDAIGADVDAICTGEGEFAFTHFFERFRAGGDFTDTRNFWFKRDGEVVRNGFLPLMSPAEMEDLPFPQCGEREYIYQQGRGFVPLGLKDYLSANGLSYNTIWSIGCPFHCSFCGNTKFIANDPKYKKIRHPSARYVVDEVKSVRRRFPHISTVVFHDDSFMALPMRDLQTFAELWREELRIPFAVYGVIPNYVSQEKFEILTWAGMNRIRMGIQSGSARILDFYKRPTPIEKVENAGRVCASFAPKYHIRPSYDIIVDNPIEDRQDVLDTLELLYRLDRPYTLNVYSLKVIPNTELERAMKERGLDIEEISSNYSRIPPRWANLLVYLIAIWRPPRSLWNRLVERAQASRTPQPDYPVTATLLRLLFFIRRGLDHLLFMDFSTIPGSLGYLCWRTGLVSFWWQHFTPRPERQSSPPLAFTPLKVVRGTGTGSSG